MDAIILKTLSNYCFGDQIYSSFYTNFFHRGLEESTDKAKGQTSPVRWLLSLMSAIVCWRERQCHNKKSNNGSCSLVGNG